IAITRTGTINNQGLILNDCSMEAMIAEVSVAPLASTFNPRKAKIINVMLKVGTVVSSIYRMCVNRSVPAIAAARFVVSDSGESLSPKYEPETTAPATIPRGIPKALPIPIRAMPTVAEVVQELPVATEIIAQIITVAGRKTEVLRI